MNKDTELNAVPRHRVVEIYDVLRKTQPLFDGLTENLHIVAQHKHYNNLNTAKQVLTAYSQYLTLLDTVEHLMRNLE